MVPLKIHVFKEETISHVFFICLRMLSNIKRTRYSPVGLVSIIFLRKKIKRFNSECVELKRTSCTYFYFIY